MLLGILVGTVFATIFTVYFVKLARWLCALLQVVKREAEWRIRDKYELPGPVPLQKGLHNPCDAVSRRWWFDVHARSPQVAISNPCVKNYEGWGILLRRGPARTLSIARQSRS